MSDHTTIEKVGSTPEGMTDKFPPSVLDSVVLHNLCIGCGFCAGLLPNRLHMAVDAYGANRPEVVSADAPADWGPKSLAVCPFADHEANEDTIAVERFAGQPGVQHRTETGYYVDCFVGTVADEADRMASASGGVLTWLATDLLRTGAVDGVVCVGRSDRPDRLFDFLLVREPADLARCKKSRYYPAEVSAMLPVMRRFEGRLAFIGLPCFVKAMHYAMAVEPALRQRVAYCLGLFCGHLQTRQYAWYLARSCGVQEHDIVTVDFRKKVPERRVHYLFEVEFRQAERVARRETLMRDVFASNWSLNLFMHDACDCCDDVMAETADVAVGDAWMQPYASDFRGTNVVVCRHEEMRRRLLRGVEEGALRLAPISAEQVALSQEGCLRHRRQGLAYRLHLARRRGEWRPTKRVAPAARPMPLFNRLIQRIRLRTKRVSREAFLEQQQRGPGLKWFVRRLRPWVWLHDTLYRVRGYPAAALRRVRRLMRGRAARG